MSIQMTQDFVYETDDLTHFGIVLKAVIEVMFCKNYGSGGGSEYTQLHLKAKPDGFNDGRYECYRHRNPPKILPHGTTNLIVDTDRIHGGATVLKVVGEEKDLDKAARKVAEWPVPPELKVQPKYLWISTLADYKSNMKPEDVSVCNHLEMHEKAMALMREARSTRKGEFLTVCGDGYHYGFNNFDGSVALGYRMSYSPTGGWNNLNLSFCHAYYGK